MDRNGFIAAISGKALTALAAGAASIAATEVVKRLLNSGDVDTPAIEPAGEPPRHCGDIETTETETESKEVN